MERLAALFEKFPGIGPRQAGRFVQHLLRSSPALRQEMSGAIASLSGSVALCNQCMRYHAGSKRRCSICSSNERDKRVVATVASDADLAAIERSGNFRGTYFVLGGTISLASEKLTNLRFRELMERLERAVSESLEEVILAFPANPEGDATAIRIREEVQAVYPKLRVTLLGRGLSTGSELEYADPDTIRSALEGRK